MSKLAYHVDHFKAGNIRGIAMHNWEKRGEHDEHSNQDIDPARSHLNVQLIEQERSLYVRIKKDIEERCTGRVTAASNWMTESITYPPENIMDDRAKCIEYFRDVLSWHQKEFGAENIKSAVIHFDETTPHMHTDLVPLTVDGRLSTKEVFARKNLNRHHTELTKYLQERGWDIQRGEPTPEKKKKASTVKEYKREAEETRRKLDKEISDQAKLLGDIKSEYECLDQGCNELLEEKNGLARRFNELVDSYEELQDDHQELSKEVQALRDVKAKARPVDELDVRVKGFGSNKKGELPMKDLEHILEVYKKNPALERENYELRAGNSRLSQENHRLNTRVMDLIEEKRALQEEVKELRPLKEFLKVHDLLDKAKQWYRELREKRQKERKEQENVMIK